jgi:predicted enzyme related to lactoylglutathione lyase
MANPFVHVELNTTDLDRAKSFYGQLFDWKLEDVPMGPTGRYTMIRPGKGTGGGMLKHPVPGEPSSWLAYVEVDDVAASTQKAKSLGAKIKLDVTDMHGAGWMSIIVDPTGGVLGLWKSKPAPKAAPKAAAKTRAKRASAGKRKTTKARGSR